MTGGDFTGPHCHQILADTANVSSKKWCLRSWGVSPPKAKKLRTHSWDSTEERTAVPIKIASDNVFFSPPQRVQKCNATRLSCWCFKHFCEHNLFLQKLIFVSTSERTPFRVLFNLTRNPSLFGTWHCFVACRLLRCALRRLTWPGAWRRAASWDRCSDPREDPKSAAWKWVMILLVSWTRMLGGVVFWVQKKIANLKRKNKTENESCVKMRGGLGVGGKSCSFLPAACYFYETCGHHVFNDFSSLFAKMFSNNCGLPKTFSNCNWLSSPDIGLAWHFPIFCLKNISRKTMFHRNLRVWNGMGCCEFPAGHHTSCVNSLFQRTLRWRRIWCWCSCANTCILLLPANDARGSSRRTLQSNSATADLSSRRRICSNTQGTLATPNNAW